MQQKLGRQTATLEGGGGIALVGCDDSGRASWMMAVQGWKNQPGAASLEILPPSFVQSADAKQREAVKQAFWDRMDGLKAVSEH